jgi:hypothetical protein
VYAAAIEKIITETAGMTIGDLGPVAEISDLHAVSVDNLTGAARMITDIEDQLRVKISAVRRDLDTAQAALAAGYSINPGGIMHYAATEIDMLAARRHDAYIALIAACRAVAALPKVTTLDGKAHHAPTAPQP